MEDEPGEDRLQMDGGRGDGEEAAWGVWDPVSLQDRCSIGEAEEGLIVRERGAQDARGRDLVEDDVRAFGDLVWRNKACIERAQRALSTLFPQARSQPLLVAAHPQGADKGPEVDEEHTLRRVSGGAGAGSTHRRRAMRRM